eukprot:7056821-Lingulodinium_polyedra.AAC.1
MSNSSSCIPSNFLLADVGLCRAFRSSSGRWSHCPAGARTTSSGLIPWAARRRPDSYASS